MRLLKRLFPLPPLLSLALIGLLCWLPSWIVICTNEKSIVLTLLSLLCVGLLFAIAGRKVHWLGALWVLFFPAEMAALILAGESVSFGLVQATFQTNPGEASELIGTYLIITAISLSYWAIYLWAFLSWQRRSVAIRPLFRWGVTALFVLYLLGITLGKYNVYTKFKPRDKQPFLALEYTKGKMHSVFPIDVLYSTAKYIQVRREEKSNSERIGDGAFEVIASPISDTIPSSEYPIVLFIIGETGNVSHWQLYGYERATTPLLAQTDRLIVFEDVRTGATLTSLSLPMLISRSTPHEPQRWQYEGTLIHLFRKAHFSTAWLGNQASPFAVVQSALSKVDYQFNSGKEYASLSSFDEVLLPPLDSYLQQVLTENRAAFAVLHTLGSHFRYDARTPKSFDYYTPTTRGYMTTTILDREHRQILLNSYDNSIRYTDYFLHQVIERMKGANRPMVLLYLPDHGEGLGEINPKNMLHGSEYALRDELAIPLIIAYNEKYEERNEQLLGALRSKTSLPISSIDVPALLVRLAGIKAREFPISIADSSYKEQPRVYLGPSLKVHSAEDRGE